MARYHGFHPVQITRIVDEAPDVRTFALDARFPYRAGQFLTFKACGTLRSYSMSSSPDTDGEMCVTVKRVPGGLVSGWMHQELKPGDTLEVTRPAGAFCLRDESSRRPLVAYAGGSGITPVFSLVKSALATTSRPVRLLSAHQSRGTAIFSSALDALAARHPGRLDVRHHLDDRDGLVTGDEIRALVDGHLRDADFYLCGPVPFMRLVEETLAAEGAAAERIIVERFTPAEAEPAPTPAPPPTPGVVTVDLRGERRTVPQRPGETLLQSARRAGLMPPFSCEAGDCATCMARLTSGEAKMRVNNALDPDEVAEGWVLTCQAEPTTPDVSVLYED
ncbi:ferredoxin--NADP reductase [Streptomyces sp. Li-HN-5-11]|uniref:ferredoxin--NADP reductase n=1 Tax=Streptomyces sp. Li-HN-5-11 TaxID=3075432 RepID=UPI0028AE92A4|nr:ferredoxin--NADP reductase [Streptomyces sp. Li-HN-5-11]WNM31893.1 ferredoxin--NADP reductase [Streptomyces sp. Li-HN-5-11]